jgi:hypothetical protein
MMGETSETSESGGETSAVAGRLHGESRADCIESGLGTEAECEVIATCTTGKVMGAMTSAEVAEVEALFEDESAVFQDWVSSSDQERGMAIMLSTMDCYT